MIKQLPQKPHLLKIVPPLENSIVIKGDEIAWNNPWHYHPEIELLYCIKGKGTNFVGNSIRSIEEGELLLFGSNLPHTRQRDKEYYQAHPDESPESIVIQFREDALGDKFFELKELSHIRELIHTASRGVKFNGVTKDLVIHKLKRLKDLTGFAAIIELLEVLNLLACSADFTFINSVHYLVDLHEESSKRINAVYDYTIAHFREHISLADVALLTNHSTAAFCRYFKTRTRKTYFQYLTEIRIAYACELLMQGNLDVTRICYASGFNNISNFHKQFKKLIKATPMEYRNQSSKKISRINVDVTSLNPLS